MKRVLVTGAHGFIGSAFCKVAGRTFQILPVSRNTKPPLPPADIIVHLAARTAKVKNDATSLATYRRDNVLGTKRLLSVLSKKPLYVLYVSTTDVLVTPLTPYAKSKLESEKIISDYCKANTIPLGIARLGSVYGPGEGEYGKVIPTFIKLSLADKSLKITGDRRATRQFIYVDDAAKLLLSYIQTKKTGIMEVTGKKEISIVDLAKRIRYLANNKIQGRTPFDKNLLSEIDWFRKRQAIYFDVDGTILNYWKRLYAVYRACCAAYGYTPLPLETFQRNRRNGLPDATTTHRVWKQRRIEATPLLAKDTVVPGMKRVLRHVYKTHRVVAVSARQSKEKLMNQLEHLGIRALFDEIIAVGLDDPVRAKAHAMGEGIAVGDTEMEIAAAACAGIRCIAVGWGTRNAAFLRRAGLTLVVQTPEALARALEADI